MSRVPLADCLTARGTVRRITPDGCAEVELAEAPGCEGCAGLCAWRRLGTGRPTTLRLRAPDARPGASVLVSLPQRHLLACALVLHGVPWAALLAGAAAGYFATGGDLGTLAGAAAAVGLAIKLTPGLRRRMERSARRRLALHRLP